MASAAAPRPGPDGYATSPEIGPIPAITVPRSPPQTTAGALVQRAVAGVTSLARGWAAVLRQRLSIGHRRSPMSRL